MSSCSSRKSICTVLTFEEGPSQFPLKVMAVLGYQPLPEGAGAGDSCM